MDFIKYPKYENGTDICNEEVKFYIVDRACPYCNRTFSYRALDGRVVSVRCPNCQSFFRVQYIEGGK
jgi:Zn finger protein HypA/HybF involved in hydrogenase expression